MRITVKRGRVTRKFLLVESPFPKRGDVITLHNVDYIVTKTQDEKILIRFGAENGRLKQVFP